MHHPKPKYHAKNPGCRTPACDKRVGRWWWRKHHPREVERPSSMSTATASWFNDAESTACGTHYQLGVANKELPCGTRVVFCAARCATATVEDRGPFIAGRMWDLNPRLKEAIGASDLGPVRYRILTG